MSKAWLSACLIFLLNIIPLTASQQRLSAESELMRLEEVWNQAHVRGDVDALDRLWHEDFVVTVSGMPLMNKAESLALVRSGRMKFQTYKTSDLRVRMYGNSAVVTGQLERTRASHAGEFEDDWRFTKVYVRRNGRWQVVAWHASPVAS